MTVGFKIEASPLVPRFILLDVSIIVNGVEYPIRIPHNKQASSMTYKRQIIFTSYNKLILLKNSM